MHHCLLRSGLWVDWHEEAMMYVYLSVTVSVGKLLMAEGGDWDEKSYWNLLVCAVMGTITMT
jgi:hypothetical protein